MNTETTAVVLPLPADLAQEPAERHLGGLLALVNGAERPLPLREVRVRAAIAGDCCRATVEQRFRNDHDMALEVIHMFPLPPGGAVTEVVLAAGPREVRAECRPREDAERAYAEARDAGHSAVLLEAERADVHTLRAANIPPGAEVTVRMVVVERLEEVDGMHVWRFPTTIAPRYVPGTPIGHEGPGVLPDTDHVPDASRLQPPISLLGGAPLDLEVELAGPIESVSSSLHAVRVDIGETVRVAPSGRAVADRDFVLAWRLPAAVGTPTARAWTDGGHTLVVVVPPDEAAVEIPRDAVFVVDRSGSMTGTKMTAARQALSAALHGLGPADRFRILAFDDQLVEYRNGFADVTDQEVARADRWIAGIDARGGTEMLPPVRAALEGGTPAGRLRTVLVITDGEVWNDQELVAAVAHRRGGARLFTMGIDTAVNESLLRRLARLGGGTCDLVAPSDAIEEAVARLEARLGSPVVDDVRVSATVGAAAGAGAGDDGPSGAGAGDLGATGGEQRGDGPAGVPGAARAVVPADDRPVALFAGRPVSLLLEGSPALVHLEGRTATGVWSADVRPAPSLLPLGALWARERVAALEDHIAARPDHEEGLRPEILRVALGAGIASRFTSFVAVDTTVTGDGETVTVVQPVAVPHLWQDPAVGFHAASGLHDVTAALYLHQATASPRPPHLASALAAPVFRFGQIGPATEAAPAAPPPSSPGDVLGGELARLQRADGGFGDAGATAAALAALVLLGHTRRRGTRRRVVARAERFLRRHAGDRAVGLVLALLERAEKGERVEDIRAAVWSEVLVLPGFESYADAVWPDGPR